MCYRIDASHKDKVERIVQKLFPAEQGKPKRKVWSNYNDNSSRIHKENRFIQVGTPFPVFETIHYEYIASHWELHVESPVDPSDNDRYNYSKIASHLVAAAAGIENIEYVRDDRWLNVRYAKEIDINDSDEVVSEGLEFLIDSFEPYLKDCHRLYKSVDLAQEYMHVSEFKTMNPDGEVSLRNMSIRELFDVNLTIPDYQRIYCWNESNIRNLWDNLAQMPMNQAYHLGALILQCCKDKDTGAESYHIIDGQQRLVTLTIIMRAMGYEGNMPLLKQRFMSKEACDNISNAKFVIQGIVAREPHVNEAMLENIIDYVTFSVLLLNTDDPDLAYTFFTNQNQHSKGVRLSDYDILKAHHLRFLASNDLQAEHLARRWNILSQEEDSTSKERDNKNPSDSLNVHKTLGLHLFRIRKWMRGLSCNDYESDRPVKDEYSAAPLIPGIPPFCENFYFNEKIQGGSHFFAFADHFVDLYRHFVKTHQVVCLRSHLDRESHWKYESVIETVLFAYYSKFGNQYLSEALFCIAGAIAQHRYLNDRALTYGIHEYVQNSRLVMMIDQASSPSFFLAEALHLIRNSGRNLDKSDIKQRFYFSLRRVFKDLAGKEDLSARFTEKYVESKMNSEYE